jgi:hypothetical protein
MSIYDTPSEAREQNIKLIEDAIKHRCQLEKVIASRSNPIESIKKIIDITSKSSSLRSPKISIDISSFTRKHLLQLLHGLDMSGLLSSCKFFYTEQSDYNTKDNEPISQGIASISAIETFTGRQRPSLDTLLVIFLGWEGARTLALWEHLNPNVTFAVIADPPYKPDWEGRTELQNSYLLSCLPKNNIFRAHALIPANTMNLLETFFDSPVSHKTSYNYQIAPMGTKPQIIGIYRFWRMYPMEFTIVYASPLRYREEQAIYPASQTWLIDDSSYW